MRVAAEVTGRAVEFGGERHSGWLPTGASTPSPTLIRRATLDFRILEDDGGVVLEWVSRDTEDRGDRWYPSTAQAIADARELFGIEKAEWHESNVAS